MNGVAKLEDCNEKVISLKEELEKLKPNLIQKTELAEKIMKVFILAISLLKIITIHLHLLIYNRMSK